MQKILLISSLDDAELTSKAIEIINQKFEIIQVFRFNKNSPKIDSIKSEFVFHSEFQYLINFLSPKILPKWLIDLPTLASINIHPGSFEYPGVGSASLSIYDSKSTYGVCAHYMDEKIDHGGIILEQTFKQPANISCDMLFKLALNECLLLLENLIVLLQDTPKPEVVKTWSRKAVTRAEFNSWMILSKDDDVSEIEKKVNALKHPIFDGPFIKVGRHIFKYKCTEQNSIVKP
jgi:methionyl-tRNA formyltransferase